MALILAGLHRVNEGYTELTGQACPPPVALHADGSRIGLRFYNFEARVNLPADTCREAAAAVRAFGRQARRLISRRIAAFRKANTLGWRRRLLRFP